MMSTIDFRKTTFPKKAPETSAIFSPELGGNRKDMADTADMIAQGMITFRITAIDLKASKELPDRRLPPVNQ